MKLRILDRYILKEIAGPFFFGVAAFASVFIGTDVLFRIAKYIAEYGAPIWSVVKLFFVSMPEIIHYCLPMAMLLSALLAFGRLSSTSEITAMRAGGISFMRLMVPVIGVALVVSLCAFLLGEYVVPASRVAYQQILRTEIERNARPKGTEHVVIKVVTKGEIDQLIYARRFNELQGRLEGVHIEDFDKGKLSRLESADYATFENGRWTLNKGTISEISPDGEITRVLHFTNQVLPSLNAPRELALSNKRPRDMTTSELSKQIDVLKSQLAITNTLKLELYQRYALPLGCLVFALIGAPLGLQPHRASSSMGFGLSVIIILIYYVFLTVCTSLGQAGQIPPLLAAWIPNLIGFAAGFFLIHRASK